MRHEYDAFLSAVKIKVTHHKITLKLLGLCMVYSHSLKGKPVFSTEDDSFRYHAELQSPTKPVQPPGIHFTYMRRKGHGGTNFQPPGAVLDTAQPSR